RPWEHFGRCVAIGAMVLGCAQATSMFLSNAAMFVHGPNRFVGALYDSAENPKAIVYEAGAYWKFPYYPLVFSHRNEIDQYRAADNGEGLFRVDRALDHSVVRPIESVVAPYKILLVVNLKLRSYRDLRDCQNGGAECHSLSSGPIEVVLTERGQWREIRAERMFGLYDTQVKIFQYVGE